MGGLREGKPTHKFTFKVLLPFKTVVLNHRRFCPLRNIWECLETLLVVTTRGTQGWWWLLLASRGQSPVVILNILQCKGQRWPQSQQWRSPTLRDVRRSITPHLLGEISERGTKAMKPQEWHRCFINY